MRNIYLTRLANRVNRFKFNANNERSRVYDYSCLERTHARFYFNRAQY